MPGAVPMFLALGSTARGGGGAATQNPNMPTSANTGPRIGLTTSSGDYTLSSGSISGLHITGSLYLAGPNVSATDCQVDGSILFNSAPGGNYGNPNPWANQTVSYCRTGHIDSAGVDTATIDHVHVDGSLGGPGTLMAILNNAGPPVKNLTVTNSLFDNPASVGAGTGFHLEAFHLSGCQTGLIQNNVFNWNADTATQAQTTACVNIDNSGNVNINLDGNWFFGGGPFQIYYTVLGTSFATNNKFSTPPTGTQFDSGAGNTHFTQSGNTLDGSPFTLPYDY